MKHRLISAIGMLGLVGGITYASALGQTLGLSLVGVLLMIEWMYLPASRTLKGLGLLYIVGGWSFFCLRAWAAAPWISYMALAWVIDTSAYGIGRWIQGPLLAPQISPKKTLSGACGGLIMGVVWGYYVLHLPLLCVGILSLGAQGGDLLESWVKRTLNIKDTGRWIPGHGGILDRCDSTLALGWIYTIFVPWA